MPLSLAEKYNPPQNVETPQTFYKKPDDASESEDSLPFSINSPTNDVVADKVLEGIHKRLRDEGKTIVNMAQLCEFEPAFVNDNTKLLPRAFSTAKDLQIFLLTHDYLESFKADAAKNLPIYELRYKYQTNYGIMYVLAQNLNCKFSVAKTTPEYRAKLREQYGVKFVNTEPENAMQFSEIESRLERIEQLLVAVASQVEYIHEFTHIKSYD